MTTLLTALPYADWLVGRLQDEADNERRALYEARRTKVETIPVTVVRHQCPYCRVTRAKRQAARDHVARCWDNPAVRACKTCVHFWPAEAAGHEEPGAPQECAIGAAVPVITDCPQWQCGTGDQP